MGENQSLVGKNMGKQGYLGENFPSNILSVYNDGDSPSCARDFLSPGSIDNNTDQPQCWKGEKWAERLRTHSSKRAQQREQQ